MVKNSKETNKSGIMRITTNPIIPVLWRFPMTSIIPDLASNENAVSSRIDQFFIQNSFSKLLKRCNFYKEAGIPCVIILKELFTLVFTGKNLFRTLETRPEDLSFRKNTAYRFLNTGHFNWSKLCYYLHPRSLLL